MPKPTVSSSQSQQASCTTDNNKTLRCAQCSKYFGRKNGLRCHLLIHDKTSQSVCQICSASFASYLRLSAHKRNMHSGVGERYRCTICASRFAVKYELSQHERAFHGEPDSWKCRMCPEAFNRKERLRAHMQRHRDAGTPFGCSRCPKAFRRGSECWKHIVKCHAPNLRNQFSCAKCPMVFEFKHKLRYHTITAHVAGRPYHCEHCPATFKLRESCVGHQRIHAAEKPYGCAQCGARCKLRHDLVVHLRTHCDDKPFVCHVCGHSTKSNRRLREHLQTHRNVKPFRCRFCGTDFKSSSGRVSHEAACKSNRNTIKPHSCQSCLQIFSCTAYLRLHRQRCRGLKKRFGCSHCPAAYEYRATLVNHLAIHAQKHRRLHVCRVCFTVSKDTKAQRQHEKYAHSEGQLYCAKCEQRFKLKTDLAKHALGCMVSCSQCGVVFASSRRLRRHLRTVHVKGDFNSNIPT